MYKFIIRAIFFLAASTAVIATPQAGKQCSSDTDCDYGYSCCKAVPFPKCTKLLKGTVC
ncbi:hypothetical protein BDZ97DRAFT_1827066 [Flammula alnicola]|nr:hypothetical protein BDZ97DRAFT_1827066 [Flammula alnicola]